MKRKIKTIGMILLILTAMITAFVIQVSAKPEYVAPLQDAYGKGSCADCHTNPSGGKSLTAYGSEFKSQPNYKSATSAAILAIGPPGGTPVVTATPIVAQTTIVASTPNTTAVATAISTPVITETTTIVSTPVVIKTTSGDDKKDKDSDEKKEENDEKEETMASPGFGTIVTVGIVSIVYILRRYKF